MNHTSHKHTSRSYLFLTGAMLAVPIAVLWSWNLVIPEIFGASPLEFRNALGLVLLGLIASIPFYARRGKRRGTNLQ